MSTLELRLTAPQVQFAIESGLWITPAILGRGDAMLLKVGIRDPSSLAVEYPSQPRIHIVFGQRQVLVPIKTDMPVIDLFSVMDSEHGGTMFCSMWPHDPVLPLKANLDTISLTMHWITG